MTKEAIIRRAQAEIGTKEYPPNSNNVKYNTWFYGHPVNGSNYPWCAAFISWLFRDCQDLVPKTASCLNMLAFFEQNHQIVTNPEPGDIQFMKFNTNNRKTNHVGLFIGKMGSTNVSIEGNTSLNSNDNGGSVMQRERTRNIVAYGRPKYVNSSPITPVKPTIPIPVTVKQGSKGETVTLLQQLLVSRGYVIGIDGDFGPETEKAVRDFQNKQHLGVDGVVGPKTWTALLK